MTKLSDLIQYTKLFFQEEIFTEIFGNLRARDRLSRKELEKYYRLNPGEYIKAWDFLYICKYLSSNFTEYERLLNMQVKELLEHYKVQLAYDNQLIKVKK